MPSRDQLLREMRNRIHHPATARELIRVLEIPREERQSLKRQLQSLVSDGALVRVRGNRYGLADRMDLVVGRLDAHPSGFGFVTPERPIEVATSDVFVAAPNLKQALHGERVVVRIEGHRSDGRCEGRVVQILERRARTVVGRYDGLVDRRYCMDTASTTVEVPASHMGLVWSPEVYRTLAHHVHSASAVRGRGAHKAV